MSGSALSRRAAGAAQTLGGGLEVVFGLGFTTLPEPMSTDGGIIIVVHGGDAAVAGFHAPASAEVHAIGDEPGMAARSDHGDAVVEHAEWLGLGATTLPERGPSIGVAVSRVFAFSDARSSETGVLIAYLKKGQAATRTGHNAVGIRMEGHTIWYHNCVHGLGQAARGELPGQAEAIHHQAPRYLVSELAVSGTRHEAARHSAEAGRRARDSRSGLKGLRCAEAAASILESSGIAIPAGVRTPFLLYRDVRWGKEITIVGGSAAAAGVQP
ncbi:MAG: hypothetical protein KDA64_17855 [Rhodospirillaceae bacterium]|nr:hypothetical protein [Rhodospirillaceae bacterium]